jgi:hypothetical protein
MSESEDQSEFSSIGGDPDSDYDDSENKMTCKTCSKSFDKSLERGCSVLKELCKACHVEDKRDALLGNTDVVDISNTSETPEHPIEEKTDDGKLF